MAKRKMTPARLGYMLQDKALVFNGFSASRGDYGIFLNLLPPSEEGRTQRPHATMADQEMCMSPVHAKEDGNRAPSGYRGDERTRFTNP
jgi:hypothetical protein